MRSIIITIRLIVLCACGVSSLVLNGNLNSSFYLFRNTRIDSSVIDSSSRLVNDQFHDLTLSLADNSGGSSITATGYVYKRDRTENNFRVQLPILNYRYQPTRGNLNLIAGRFNQVTDFNLFKMDGVSIGYNFLDSWQLDGAAGFLVDSGLYFGGKDNFAGYTAITRNFTLRNSVKMTFSRAERDKKLVANDLGLHLKLNTEKKWHLALGGKITQANKDSSQTKGYKFTESYSRLTYTPKKLKYQFYIGTHSFSPSLYDPTDFYYFEYLFYNKFFVGARYQISTNSILKVQGDVINSEGKSFGNVSAYWIQKYLSVKVEKGFVESQNDYIADASVKYGLSKWLILNTGGSIVHYQTRANSFPGASDRNNMFTSLYVSSELNLPHSFLIRAKLENRTNRKQVYDVRLSLNLSYSFTTEQRERFPWEY